MAEKKEEGSIIRVNRSTLALLWSIFAGIVGVWWNGQKQAVEQKIVSTQLVATVSALDRTVQSLEERQSRFYTATDAARDLSQINARIDDHEARLRSTERGKR